MKIQNQATNDNLNPYEIKSFNSFKFLIKGNNILYSIFLSC